MTDDSYTRVTLEKRKNGNVFVINFRGINQELDVRNSIHRCEFMTDDSYTRVNLVFGNFIRVFDDFVFQIRKL